MNLFSILLFQKTASNQLIKPRQLKTINQLKKLFSICLVMLFTSLNVHAFELDIDTTNINDTSIEGSNNWTYLNLANGKLIKKIPSLLVFTPRNAAYFVKKIKKEYLTLYSKKNKKLNATYDSGAYLIKYTHRW